MAKFELEGYVFKEVPSGTKLNAPWSKTALHITRLGKQFDVFKRPETRWEKFKAWLNRCLDE